MYEEEDVKFIELYATTFEEDEYSMVTWVQLIGYFFSSRVDKWCDFFFFFLGKWGESS